MSECLQKKNKIAEVITSNQHNYNHGVAPLRVQQRLLICSQAGGFASGVAGGRGALLAFVPAALAPMPQQPGAARCLTPALGGGGGGVDE